MITYLLTSIYRLKLYDCILTYKSIYSIFIPNVHKKIQTKRSIYNAYMQTLSYKHLQVTKLTDLNMNEHHYQVQDLSTSQQLPPQQNIIFFIRNYICITTKIIFRHIKLIYDTWRPSQDGQHLYTGHDHNSISRIEQNKLF